MDGIDNKKLNKEVMRMLLADKLRAKAQKALEIKQEKEAKENEKRRIQFEKTVEQITEKIIKLTDSASEDGKFEIGITPSDDLISSQEQFDKMFEYALTGDMIYLSGVGEAVKNNLKKEGFKIEYQKASHPIHVSFSISWEKKKTRKKK